MPVDVAALAATILAEAGRAANETDLRVRIEPAVDAARVELGLTAAPEREKSLVSSSATAFRGQADTMYGALVIEYERPGALATVGGLKHAAKQVRDYMFASASKSTDRELEALRRHAGVVFDGQQLGFLRANGPVLAAPLDSQLETLIPLDGPYAVSAGSVSQLLVYLRALARKRLDAQALAEAFGPAGAAPNLARDFVSHLVTLLGAPALPPKASLLRDEWFRMFGAVYSQDTTKARQDAGVLARLYGADPRTRLPVLLFAVQTYYALLMKLLAVELLSLQSGSIVASQATRLASATTSDRLEGLRTLEAGTLFLAHGIENFLEGDYFSWYLDAWDAEMDSLAQRLAQELTQFEPATATIEPGAVRDLLKELYQYLVPKKVRHDLGEYYTPDWLADHLLDRAGYHGRATQRLVDPACGSGTFLLRAIGRVRQTATDALADDGDTAAAILRNVVGFDLNPVAVLAARTNYLLALGPLLRRATPLSIPVYLADSLLAPLPYSRLVGSSITSARSDHLVSVSSEGDFKLPLELANPDGLRVVTEELERAIPAAIGPAAFVARVARRQPFAEARTQKLLEELYSKVARLAAVGKDGIWARLLRNAFAPALSGKFDFVVGNPPWINWESLSDDYRKATARLWQLHGLFTLKGMSAILGGSKRDIAMLFWVCCADYYLRDGGTIAFLFPQTAFQTSPAGDGFRRFLLMESTPIGPAPAGDLVAIQPFDGASNWTGYVVGHRGHEVSYPLPYELWTRLGVGVPQAATLADALAATAREDLVAAPSSPLASTSPWVIGTPRSVAGAQRMAGSSPYEAHAGVTTWADGVFFGTVGEPLGDGSVPFANDAERAKAKSKPRKLPMAIEPDFVFPFIEWRDVRPFSARASGYVLVPQDPVSKRGYSEVALQRTHPRTYDFLAQFRTILENRSGYRRYFMRPRRKGKPASSDAFYSIFNFGSENLSPVRVVWGTMGSRFRAAVVEAIDDPSVGRKPPQVKNTVIFTAASSADEAHYLCALLNSTPLNYLAVFSTVRGGKSFGSGGFFERVRIDHYDPGLAVHAGLAAASRAAHEAVNAGDASALEESRVKIDVAAATYWGLDPDELSDMGRLLTLIGSVPSTSADVTAGEADGDDGDEEAGESDGISGSGTTG